MKDRKRIFVTGTGTDVGKTYVTGLMLKKLRENGVKAAYYKAAMSGNDRDEDGHLIPGDALEVKTISGIDQPLEDMCPYVYETAVSPHLASRIEGNPVDMDVVMKGYEKVCDEYEVVTAEGSGGIICPIGFDTGEIYLENVIRAMDMDCIMVADAGLGTINSVVLTAEYIERAGIGVRGIILNHFHEGDVMEEDNLRMCEHLTGIKVIACVADGDEDLDIGFEELMEIYS